MNTTTKQLRVGTLVTVEETRGLATPNPVITRHEGRVHRDDEGTLRVGDVNVTRDAEGYFPRGVLIISAGGAK